MNARGELQATVLAMVRALPDPARARPNGAARRGRYTAAMEAPA